MIKELRSEFEIGEFPLLTNSQLTLFDEVNAFIRKKVYNEAYMYLPNDDYETQQMMLQVSVMEKKLKIIMKHLKEGRRSKLLFDETYPRWKINREDCIDKLKEIAESLDNDRFNCNVSKLVGYSTSLVGGGITIASAILIPFTFGLTTPLAIAGGAITAAGCGTAIGTSITEVVLLKTKIENAKTLIEEDKKHFGNMSNWLNNASELQKALSDILNIDIVKQISGDIKDFVARAIALKDNRERFKLIEKWLPNVFRDLSAKFAYLSLPHKVIAEIITVLVAVFLLLLNTENRLVFDCASVTIRSILGVASILNNSKDIFFLSRLLASGNAEVAKNFAKAITRGGVAAVGIALDIAGIAITSVDIHKGSRSPEAKKIREATQELKEEADTLEKVYNGF